MSYLWAGRSLGASLPTRQLKEHLLAALSLTTPQLRVEDPDGAVARLRARLAALPELGRELQPLADKLIKSPQGTLNLSRFARGLSRTADRVGLVLCNDLGVAARIAGSSGAPSAVDELTAWGLSDAYLALRDQLGLSVAV